MRFRVPEPRLAQTIAWIWLGVLLAALVAWLTYRYWRKRHPPVPPALERSYSRRLEERLTKGQGSATRQRRGGTGKGGKRRP